MKILILGPYPIENPSHGGQLRARAIYDEYQANGFDVYYNGIVGKDWYKQIGEGDIEIEISYDEPSYTYALDVMMSEPLQNNNDAMVRLHNLIEEIMPDIIQIEQPYLFPALRSLIDKAKTNYGTKIIYSSHNIEASMKKDILFELIGSNLTEKDAQYLVDQAHAIEKEFAIYADLTVACTAQDEAILRKMGAKKTIVCMNGSGENKIDDENLQSWKDLLKVEGVSRFSLFVGSGHPPNATGFNTLIGYTLGDLPRHTRVYIAGGVCGMLENHLKILPAHVRESFLLRAKLLGVVSNEDLASLLHLTDVMLLPIISGGGSNLKTAEALLTGKIVIGTDVAFRSYDSYKKLHRVNIANNRNAFRSLLHDALTGKIELQANSRDEILEVTWKYTLANLAERVKAI